MLSARKRRDRCAGSTSPEWQEDGTVNAERTGHYEQDHHCGDPISPAIGVVSRMKRGGEIFRR